MIDYNISKLEKNNKNTIIIKNINLDSNLDFFMLIDTNDKDYASIIENNILDFIIDKISIENSYKDFSIALEKINNILREYNKNKEKDTYLNIILAILNKNDFIFSEIGKPSLYLIKETLEVIEVTDKKENKKEFSFISEWILEHKDILVISTTRLLNYLSYSDFVDSSALQNTQKINKNIILILEEEKVSKNIWLFSLKYIDEDKKIITKSKLQNNLEKVYYKIIDNNIVKFILAYFKIAKEKLEKKSKFIKNIFLILWMLFATIFLYFLISQSLQTTTNNTKQQEYKKMLELAKTYKITASNNYNNPDIFSLNIEKSEEIINKLKKEKLYLNEIKKLEYDLNTIKKAFNWIEVYKENDKNLVYSIPEEYKKNILKTIKINWKIFLITKKSIIWPIWKDKKPEITEFQNIWDDEFIDATPLNTSIILLTKNWKVVEFLKSRKFFYRDVLWQYTWEKADSILNYWRNSIYLISKDSNQIFKHSRVWNNFSKAKAYLKEEDSKSIWKIISLAIDWGFYLLKQDLSLIKFFSSPYRLENIKLNKIPDTYKNNNSSKIKIIAKQDLNYVYILLNNKIWIFKPNTRLYKSVKSLKYLWQIEAETNKIIDFYVEQDSKILILSKKWIYNISWNENDWKILVNN